MLLQVDCNDGKVPVELIRQYPKSQFVVIWLYDGRSCSGLFRYNEETGEYEEYNSSVDAGYFESVGRDLHYRFRASIVEHVFIQD